jgi:hypothetical protein
MFSLMKKQAFMINIDYHKGQSITRNTKNNIRFLSYEVSYLLCTYLIFIQSFYDFIKINIRNEDTLSSYLFENNNKEFTSEHLINVIKEKLSCIYLNHFQSYVIDMSLNISLKEKSKVSSMLTV